MGNKEFLKTKSFYLVTFLLVLFILHPMNILGKEENPENTYTIEIKDNLITVDVEDADLSEVLKEIEKGTGVKITIGKELIGKKITAQFEDLDIESALKEILNRSDSHYVLTFLQDPENKEKFILKEVKAEGDIIGSRPLKVKMVTVDIPYGSGKGEVGAFDEGEGALMGPKSFAVDDKGNIYICDTVNSRVLIFSSGGKYLSTIPIITEGMAEDIVIDSSGFVYIYDNLGKLLQYDKNGNFVNKINIDESRLGGGGTMHIINNEIYIYACDYSTCRDFIIGGTLSNNVLVSPSTEELKNLKDKGKQGLSGKKYMTGLKRFEKGELEIKDKDSTTLKSMSFPLKEILSIKFLGEDKRENLFIKTERDDENKKLVVEVHKFNTDGDYLNTIQMPESNICFWSLKNYEVNKEGTIYEFSPEKEKLRLNIFPGEFY